MKQDSTKCYIDHYLCLFYDNKILYKNLYSYLDADSLYSLIFINKDFYKKKNFIYKLILSKCAYYIPEINHYEYSRNLYYNKVYNKSPYESNKEFILDFGYYNKNYELNVLYKNKKLCEKFDKLRRYNLKY